MKKILFISGIQIFPPESGGQLRSANICKALVDLGFKVEIYSFTGRKKDYFDIKPSAYQFINQNLIEYINRNPVWGLVQFIFYRLKLPPLWLTCLSLFHCPTNLKKMMEKSNSIVLDFPYLYPLAKRTKGPCHLNTHNAEFELFKEKTIISNLVKKIELKSFLKADHVLFCNKRDQIKFMNNYPELQAKSYFVPNGVDLNKYQHDEDSRQFIRKKHNISIEQKVFIFSGSLYHPNIEAFNFLKQWATSNKEELKRNNILILVVGSVGQSLIDDKHFKVIGKVESVLPYFWASDYGINPTTLGSGTNIKMIEFLASGIPIMTTSFGARGLNLVDKETCIHFERNLLLAKIKHATTLNLKERQNMASKALNENLLTVDIMHSLRNLSILW